MLTALKGFILIIVLALNSFTFPFFGNFTGNNGVTDSENIKLNFAAISDLHMTESDWREFIVKMGLTDMERSDYDALVLTGDLTDHGYREQYESLLRAMNGYTPADNIILAVGNHDTWTRENDNGDTFTDLFTEYANKIAGTETETAYYSTTVNGYTFIVMASEKDMTAAYFSDTQLNWLRNEMEKASESGLPIFVISHWPLNQTHGLPTTWGDDEPEFDDGGMGDQSDRVEKILKDYDNVFLISGHIHSGFVNEEETDTYGYCSVESDGSFHSINLPSFQYPTTRGRVANGTGLQFEVYEDEVIIRARSFTASVWYTNYVFEIPLV